MHAPAIITEIELDVAVAADAEPTDALAALVDFAWGWLEADEAEATSPKPR